MGMTEWIQILAATVGSLGFALLFNIRGIKLVAVSLGGGGAWALQIGLSFVVESEMLSCFIVALTISFYAELMARLLKSPATVFIAPCLIPMVPGASLYYTMSHALNNQWQGFLERGLATVKIAAALAIGIIVSVVVMRVVLHTAFFLRKQRALARKGEGENAA